VGKKCGIVKGEFGSLGRDDGEIIGCGGRGLKQCTASLIKIDAACTRKLNAQNDGRNWEKMV